ncbi:MAG TPA: acyl-CoA dehydratase activase [Methylomirabilota bacterium]|jgi:predicted CoA-substrate-specific enzyme activase|nr:acyl-CoA dehydratase activase [Methylomirabilota bacterium]
MLVAGVDLGSGTTKCVLVDEQGAVRGRGSIRTKVDFAKVARETLEAARLDAGPTGGDVGYVATTGLGRYAIPFRDIQITDLTCGARGAAALCPESRYVLDIGAQCSRAIKLRDGGKVKEFHMNEKCAAGSGGFLERAAKYLEVTITDIGPLSLRAAKSRPISSVCAVLAESEIINHVSDGATVESILRGIHDSLADRALSLLKRVGLDGAVAFIGGVAQQEGMVVALREKLRVPVHVPESPQFTTALGAALLGLQRYRKLATIATGGRP